MYDTIDEVLKIEFRRQTRPLNENFQVFGVNFHAMRIGRLTENSMESKLEKNSQSLISTGSKNYEFMQVDQPHGHLTCRAHNFKLYDVKLHKPWYFTSKITAPAESQTINSYFQHFYNNMHSKIVNNYIIL